MVGTWEQLHRREVLRLAMLGAVSAGVAPLLGCSSGSDAATTTTSPPTTAPFDPTVPWWLQGGFAPVSDEVDATDLEVEGALPPELSGLYVRNGSNPRTGTSPHWFLGDGMLHGIRLEGGKAASYRNRYVRTPLYEASSGFGEGVPGGEQTQSNVSAIWHGGRLLTSGEIGYPFEISPADLSTVGVHDFDGRLATSMTAHPKIDPATGQLHFFGYGFVAPYLTYHVADADGTLVHSTEVPVPGPTMIHDFAITEQDAVFWDLPVVFDLDAAVAMIEDPTSGTFPFSWDPSYGARVGVLPLGGDGAAVRWADLGALLRVPRRQRVPARAPTSWWTCAATRRCSKAARSAPGWRCTGGRSTPTRGAPVEEEVDARSDMGAAVPRPASHGSRAPARLLRAEPAGRRHGRPGWRGEARLPHRRAPGVGPRSHRARWRVALRRRSRQRRRRRGVAVGLPARRGHRANAEFVVLDATDVVAGPVASVALPQRVPYGFHAAWVPDD